MRVHEFDPVRKSSTEFRPKIGAELDIRKALDNLAGGSRDYGESSRRLAANTHRFYRTNIVRQKAAL